MKLQLCSWQEVESYLERHRGIIVPIGSTEQHGPNGLVGTDALCPEVIAHGAGEREGIMVAPTLSIGMAQHHLSFPGSMTLRPRTLIAVVYDVVQSLTRHGFSHIYFLNGHGGNINTVQAAFAEYYADYSLHNAPDCEAPGHLKLGNWFAGQRVKALSAELFGDREGSHATCSEVSLTYYAYPEAIKQVKMSPEIAPNGSFRDAVDFRRRFPDGRMGSDPSLATPEKGKQLFEAGIEDLLEDYQAFLAA
ncbi:creatininase family protein [Natronospira bacteriovora]|uniref:Creatininase family protein n=1 Tax=Natronospira bacteriovora TaxID=3069753 RepID=A0ABU0W7D1_9GAMM|nr:creatininase family protein [Natronospira sp. AB-CW4]MDQ2068910.1 creatininase family protein [Natronospira sp. AB-CW4]